MPFPNYGLINPVILEGINRYVLLHEKKGHFLTAVLCNNLKEAFYRADDNNTEHMFHVVSYCYNEIPSVCWGSPEEVKAWLEMPKEQWDLYPRTIPENPREMLRQMSQCIWNSHTFKNEVEREAANFPC